MVLVNVWRSDLGRNVASNVRTIKVSHGHAGAYPNPIANFSELEREYVE